MKSACSLLVLWLATGLALGQTRYTIADEDASGPGSPRVVVLRDSVGHVEAAVAPSQGGELSSYRVQFKGQWVEMLYHARDYSPGQIFKGKGPLLWPAVGAQYPVDTVPKTSCGDGTYSVAGKSYPMPCHGFARNFPWKEIARSADNRGARVTVELRDSPETSQFYPFAFQLDATFEVSGGHVTADYVVKADPSNTEPMYFSAGNHIAFKIPFLPGTDPNSMTFETDNTTQLLRNTVGVLSGEIKARSFATPERLGDFDAHTALPLAGYRSQPFARLVDPQGMTLRLTQQASSSLPEPLIRFNAFGGPKVGYFCPEPWFGVQNSLNTGKGAVRLNAGGVWKLRLDLQIEGPPPPDPAPGSGVTRFGGGFAFVEGPVWVKQGYLVFSDIYNSRILKMSVAQQPTTYREFTHAANGNSMDVEGRLYSCERDGHRVVRMEKDGSVSVVASEFEGKRLNAPNDVVVRRDGQVYFSDPASDAVLDPRELGFNGVYHVTPAGKVSLVAKMARPNGVALTPDGKTLYVSDTSQRKIMAYDLDAQGNASKERVFIDGIDGSPDGLRVAANGNLYIACRGIAIYTPDAKLVKMIEFPETPANCAFGDSDLRTLYVTARTSVYRVRVPDQGFLQY
jgi:gluconolactonase